MTITNEILKSEEKTTYQLEQERKALSQQVIERVMPKFEKASEFLADLNALFEKYPLSDDVILNSRPPLLQDLYSKEDDNN
jgi:hypothetical protein